MISGDLPLETRLARVAVEVRRVARPAAARVEAKLHLYRPISRPISRLISRNLLPRRAHAAPRAEARVAAPSRSARRGRAALLSRGGGRVGCGKARVGGARLRVWAISLGHLSISRPSLGHLSAISRPSLGCISAASRLHLAPSLRSRASVEGPSPCRAALSASSGRKPCHDPRLHGLMDSCDRAATKRRSSSSDHLDSSRISSTPLGQSQLITAPLLPASAVPPNGVALRSPRRERAAATAPTAAPGLP